jgi:hypothetical protein
VRVCGSQKILEEGGTVENLMERRLRDASGGHNETFWKIITCDMVDNIKSYPAIVNGEEKLFSFFKDVDDYFKHKVEKTYRGYQLTVTGNAVSAEVWLREQGYRALAVSPNVIEIIVSEV